MGISVCHFKKWVNPILEVAAVLRHCIITISEDDVMDEIITISENDVMDEIITISEDDVMDEIIW